MGKQLKKGRAPPGGNQFSKKVAKQSAETVMEQRSCVHFDKCVDLNKLLKKMKACKQIKCRECKEGVDMKRRSEGKVSSFSCDAAKRAVWLCLECGRYCCGGVGLPTEPQSHVMRHIKMTCHRLVIQCENTRLRWCFACQSLLPFEKEVNGERKYLLLEAVKLIKERSSKTCSGETVPEDSCSSSSISGETKGSGYGVRGLVNLGNTCFFNSVLQNLLSLDRLRDRLLKEDLSCGGPLVSSLKKLFTEATSEAGLFNSVINPWDFFGSLCSKAPQFRGYQQHDSHELLRCLLDGLSMEESSLRKKLDGDESEKPTLVDSVFGGEVSSTISCLECGHSSKVYEPFLDLSLPVPSKKQTLSQEERSKLPPPTKVLENVEDSKDSPTTMTFDNNQVPEIIVTQKDMEEVGSFWCESFGIEVSHNETDLVSQGGVSDNEDRSAKQKDKEAIMHSTETLMHDNDGSAKPDKEDAQAMQCSKETASSEISEEIDIGHSSSSAKPCADEEVPLLVADSQVLYMPYKDDKTVAEDKGEISSSYVSGHHDRTPDVSCNDKTVKERESEVTSSLVSSHHGKTCRDNLFNQSFIDFNNWDTIFDDEAVDSEEVVVRRAAIKRVLVNKAPPVLTIHLKRFSQDAQGRLSKLRGHVAFSEFIDLGLYMDMDSRQDEEDQPVYMLAGLVEHSGTMRRGHYVAYIRGDDKERRDSSVWYRASDSFVRQVSFEEVFRSEAYILFYQRI
ncbi:BnaAnng17010D [Brassica napus]|uniref:Ubiquitin carboxyl-terminal hydrolase n=1 Tax=Brassica napus TaxID=3708 RepID=A0A078J709_BRANA|nr:BnaAnng17010D [Brassica napus]